MSVFPDSSTPMAILSREGHVRETNVAFGRIFRDLKSVVGKHLADIATPEQRGSITEMLARVNPMQAVTFYVHPRLADDPQATVVLFEVTRRADDTFFAVAVPHAERARDWSKTHPAELETSAERERDETARKEMATARVLSQALKLAPVILFASDVNGWGIHSEGGGLDLLGFNRGYAPGTINIFDMLKGQPELLEKVRTTLTGGTANTIGHYGPYTFETWYVPSRDEKGEIDGTIGFSVDVTARVKSETELREKLEFIERQNAMIRSLATPIIQVWDGVLCLPVIGTVDSERASEMMQTLLDAIVQHEPRFAIVDLTGVDIVDTSTADLILRLFRAAKLVGTEGVLCGIRPAVAQAITSLGLDLGQVRTMRSLRYALEWCVIRLAEEVAEA